MVVPYYSATESHGEGTDSWRFLTQRPKTTPLFDPLFVHLAKQDGFGAEISLPTPGYPDRSWLDAPVGTQRLASADIVDIALEMVGAEQTSQAGVS